MRSGHARRDLSCEGVKRGLVLEEQDRPVATGVSGDLGLPLLDYFS